jgi:acetyl-CoA carboxylase biotin carboxyl carrier protein
MRPLPDRPSTSPRITSFLSRRIYQPSKGMDLARIQELLKTVADSGVAEVEVEEDGFKLIVRRNAAPVVVQPQMMPFPMGMPPAYGGGFAPAPLPPGPAGGGDQVQQADRTPAEPAANESQVRAPIVGTFYRAPSPTDPEFVEVGSDVNVGDVLCIIEAMKLMNEIKSEVAGKVKKILVENAMPVEYDQPLFVIET